MQSSFSFEILYQYRWMFAEAAYTTLWLTLIASLGGIVLGLFGALARIIRLEKGGILLRGIAWLLRSVSLIYVTLFRGTPLLVQIFIWSYVWFAALVHPDHGLLISGEQAAYIRSNYGGVIAGCLALAFNSGAYVTEIFRAGIQSIDKGQMEAARSLGMTYVQAMRYVILPQAFRRMLPPLANEFITLLKDSSLLSVLSVVELTFVQRTITGHTLKQAEPLYAIAVIYLLMTICLSWFFSWLDKRARRPRSR